MCVDLVLESLPFLKKLGTSVFLCIVDNQKAKD